MVAAPLLAEASEIGQVFANLGRSNLETGAELLGVSYRYAVIQQLRQGAYILRQALNDHFRHIGDVRRSSAGGIGICV